ncbi:benzoate 4-monooxygenase cytochrome P450 [Penicillium malachiteum]|nr:benzoate 4-monooxygenase cytochrome P450 [Penicillium malachiteum]
MSIMLRFSVALAALIFSPNLPHLFPSSLAHTRPPLAKVTYLYEWYYDLYQGGQFTFKLPDLHRKYGPVVRINPNEVRTDDPYFFDQVFNQTTRRANKPISVAEAFSPFSGILATPSHELHRLRRSAVSPFFSKKSVNDLVSVMWRPIVMLLERLRNAFVTGEVLNMEYFYAAVTMDIINAYCFAREPTVVKLPNFGSKSVDDVDGFLALAQQVEAIRHGKDTSHKDASHRTVIHELLNSKLPPQELRRDRIRDEAFSLVSAGSGTTAFVTRNTAYHIAANPEVRKRLHKELVTAIPDINQPHSLVTLEQLPYLTAVIQEGLRISDPISHRIIRQFPDERLECHGITIPAGTTLGMTAMLTHYNEESFPNPRTFQPELWLRSEGKRLDKFMVAFNRGTRACVGMNLARAELFMILAAVFRQFDFDVSAVKRERDIDVSRDFLLGTQAKDSPGILVTVKDCSK